MLNLGEGVVTCHLRDFFRMFMGDSLSIAQPPNLKETFEWTSWSQSVGHPLQYLRPDAVPVVVGGVEFFLVERFLYVALPEK